MTCTSPFEKLGSIPRRWLNSGLLLMFTILISLTLLTIDTPAIWRSHHQHDTHSSSLRPKEAYALYLPTSDIPQYVQDGVLLTHFGLTTDPELRDPFNRDVVVIVTNLTHPDHIRLIEAAGARIFKVPYELKPLMPSRENWPSTFYHNWDKLWVFMLTEYDRVLYLDSDTVFNKPIWPVWDEVPAQAESGLAATEDGHGGTRPGYFNAGFLMLKPDKTTFDELVHMGMGDNDLQYAEQDWLNHYFRQDGPHPWAEIDHKYVTVDADGDDITKGVHIMHSKGWGPYTHPEVRNLFYERKGRKKGWEMAQAQLADKYQGWW